MNTTSVTNVTGWAPDAASVPVTCEDADRVAAFVAAHKLEPWVELAVRLARESFPTAKAIQIYMFGGPDDEEYGERLWVEAATDVPISVDEWFRQDRNCAKRWLAATPPWVTDLMNIAFKATFPVPAQGNTVVDLGRVGGVGYGLSSFWGAV